MRARNSFSRRSFLTLASAGAAALASGSAFADDYPSRPIPFVVGFPPRARADLVARLTEASLSERLGQQGFVENRPGASTNISIQNVSASPADGYTLLFVAASAAVNPAVFKHLTF